MKNEINISVNIDVEEIFDSIDTDTLIKELEERDELPETEYENLLPDAKLKLIKKILVLRDFKSTEDIINEIKSLRTQ